MKKIYSKWLAWTAIFAVLFALFAPAISQAMPDRNDDGLVYQKVCSESGAKFVVLDLATKKGHQGSLVHFGHCAFCCLGGHVPLLGSLDISPIDLWIGVSLDWSSLYHLPDFDVPSHFFPPAQAPPSRQSVIG
jgi:Protein of unknown function (DUF2946)